MKAVGYCRISDKDQSHNSIDDQVEAVTTYCQNHNLQLEKVFIDNGRSAFTFDRPEWKQLETFIKKNKDVKYLVVKHLDRFSRANLMDALIKIDELENKLKVKVLTVSDPVDLNTDDLGVQILRSIGLLFSNNERQRIKERSTDGVYKSLKNGRFCNKAPIGYKNSTDTTGRPLLQVDYDKADLIRYIFKCYISGMEIEEIKQAARERGYRQKGNSAIQRILANPLYAGLVYVPAKKGNPSQIIPALHAPIISESDYWLVQRKLKNKTFTQQRSEDVPLRGILHCQCGLKMTAGNSRGKTGKYYWYYKCNVHKKNFPAIKLHEMFFQILDHFSLSDTDIDFFRRRITEAIETKLNNKGGELMRAKLSLQKVQQKLENTQERYLLQPDISSEVYSKVMTELKAEESRLLGVVAQLSSTGKSFYDLMDSLLPRMKNLRNHFACMPLHQQHLTINILFGYGLTFENNIYTTPLIYPLFAHNELILKEKRLLEVSNNLEQLGVTPVRTENESCIELNIEKSLFDLVEFAKIFTEIA